MLSLVSLRSTKRVCDLCSASYFAEAHRANAFALFSRLRRSAPSDHFCDLLSLRRRSCRVGAHLGATIWEDRTFYALARLSEP